MTEEEFFRSTPKKLFTLADIHKKINTPEDAKKQGEQEEKEVFIDQLFI